MDTLVIPSLLQSKLQERMATEFGSPSIIEVGGDSVTIAVEQSQQITRFLKSSKKPKSEISASKPSVLLLLSQEKLETFLDDSTCKNITCLSETQSPRQDLSALNDESVVLATTPQRAIDHIRRDNIFLSHTKAVVLAYSFDLEEQETQEQLLFREQAFLDDCRFIFTKLNPNTHIELFLDTLSHLSRSPQELLGQPTIITMADWERPRLPLECYAVPTDATDTILDILYAMQEHRYIIVHKNDSAARRLERKLPHAIPHLEITKIGFDRLHSNRRTSKPKGVASTVVAIGLDSGETVTLIRHIHEWDSIPQRIVCITEPHLAEEIITSKETLLMKNEKRSIPETDEVLAGKIQMLVAKLAIDSNPEELETLRKLFKKNVPFHRRGYFTAYLLRELLGSDKRTSSNKSPATAKATTPRESDVKQEKPQRAKKQVAKPTSQDIPEGARTLYLNIGKMRRLYAKELSQILQDNLGISREDIYSLRIHDKYSFITLSQENADKAIEKLNGMDIRGRTASITYSNKE
jgi:hypothetical protein